MINKVKRNERVAVITKILCTNPSKIFTLSYFSSILGATKSSLSEDVTNIKEIFEQRQIGKIETIPGAAGGVRYVPVFPNTRIAENMEQLCRTLSDSRRALSGGYIYMADILSDPEQLNTLVEGLTAPFMYKNIDFVLTIETKGIPIALLTARALGVPMVIARRENRINEGSQVSINYISGSGQSMQTMSLPRRAVRPGQRALIIDDFMRAGGSVKGLCDLMKEFGVTIEGIGVIIATKNPERKLVDKYHSLMTLYNVDEYQGIIDLRPSLAVKPQ